MGAGLLVAGAALCGLAGPVFSQFQPDSWAGPLAPLPTPRRLLAAAAEGGKIYTFGGCGSPCFAPPAHTSTFEETRLEIYDPGQGETGAWSAGPPIPGILFGAAAVAPGNKKIYLFGGFVTGSHVYEYDTVEKTWARKAPMPTPRHGLAAVALDGLIYVLGGSNGSSASNALEIYDPVRDAWIRKASMPTARVFLAAAAVGGRIYAIGGSPDCCGNSRTDVVEVYDPAADSWSRTTPLPVALQVSAAASANDRIYVFGGFIPGGGAQSSTLEYDPATRDWITWTPMPIARDQAPAVALNGFLYVLGGSVNCHCRALDETSRYKPRSREQEPETTADLSIRIENGVSEVQAGDRVTYTITAENLGPDPVSGATVIDRVPQALTGVRWTCEATEGARCTSRGRGSILDQNVDLAVGAVVTYTLAGTLDPEAAATLTRLSNTVTIGAPAGVTEPNLKNNRDTEIDRIKPADEDFDLGLDLTGPGEICGPADYVITVSNRGPATARDAVLDVKHPGFDLVALSSPCAAGLPCALGEIAPDAEVEITATLAPGPACPAAGKIIASVESCCDQETETLETAILHGTVEVNKSDGRDTAAPGEPILYSIVVEGLTCPISGARVTDTFPAGLTDVRWCRGAGCDPSLAGPLVDTLSLPVGGQETYRAAGTVSPGFTGLLTNTVLVEPPCGTPQSATDETLIQPTSPGVTVSCAGIAGQLFEGGVIVKGFLLRNGGPGVFGDGPGPEFEDILPAGLTLVDADSSSGTTTISIAENTVRWDGSIPVGETVTVEITATVDAGTLGTTLCNTGSISFDGDGDGMNDSDSCCFRVTPPSMEIPTLSGSGLAAVALLLALLALARLRRQGR